MNPDKHMMNKKRYIEQLEAVLAGELFSNPEDAVVVENSDGEVILRLRDLHKILLATLEYLRNLNHEQTIALYTEGAKIDKAASQGALSRTSILPIAMGENLAIKVLTNTKLEDRTKNREGFLGKGAAKTFKGCVELNFGEGSYFSISYLEAKGSVTLGPKDDKEACDLSLEELQRDVTTSHRYNSDYIATLALGPTYEKTDKNTGEKNKAVYVFSKSALCNLAEIEDFLTREELEQIKNEKAEGKIPTLYIKLFTDALRGLAAIHARGDVHNDMKGGNILVYRDENGEYSAKITDFGNSSLAEDEDKSLKESTYEFCAPESMATDIYDTNQSRSLGAQIYKANLHDYSTIPIANPNLDMWAMGITLFVALTGEYPGEHSYEKTERQIASKLKTAMEQHPVLGKLLSKNPKDRPNANEAIRLLENEFSIRNEIKKPSANNSNIAISFNTENFQRKIKEKMEKYLSATPEELAFYFIKNFTFAKQLQGQADKIYDYEIYLHLANTLLDVIEKIDMVPLSRDVRNELQLLCDQNRDDKKLDNLRANLIDAEQYDVL